MKLPMSWICAAACAAAQQRSDVRCVPTESSASRQRSGCCRRSIRAKRYGYTAAHWRENVPLYNTNLTNAEWDLVADLLERAPGQRGTPAHYSRRALVKDACLVPILRAGHIDPFPAPGRLSTSQGDRQPNIQRSRSPRSKHEPVLGK